MRWWGVWGRRIHDWEESYQFFRRGALALLGIYLVIGGVISTLALISDIPSNRIQTIVIRGNTLLDSLTIVEAVEKVFSRPMAWIVRRDISLWTPREEIASAIYALDPLIYHVEIPREFSRTLNVVITEESPTMLWCGAPEGGAVGDEPLSSVCWFANAEGTIYAPAPAYSEAPYPIFHTVPAPIFFDQYPRAHEYPVGYAIADPTTMERLSALRDALAERGYLTLESTVTTNADVILLTKEGTQFLFSLSRDILFDMRRFEALRDTLKETHTSPFMFSTVDLRFDAKVYYQ